jgi:hypothetical protein
MELDASQVILIGFVATVVAQIIKIVAAKLGKQPGRVAITLTAFGLSLVLAVIWARPSIPAWGDPMQFLNELIMMAGSVLGFATIIYNVLLDKLLGLLDSLLGTELLSP